MTSFYDLHVLPHPAALVGPVRFGGRGPRPCLASGHVLELDIAGAWLK